LDARACYRLRQEFSAYGFHYSYTTTRYLVNLNAAPQVALRCIEHVQF
jgi:hypothetical protein